MVLLCNDISHWLGANLESALLQASPCGEPACPATSLHYNSRADTRFVPSQWETALLCNNVSHWLGASLESDHISITMMFQITSNSWCGKHVIMALVTRTLVLCIWTIIWLKSQYNGQQNLNYWHLVMLNDITELGQHWFKQGLWHYCTGPLPEPM